MSVQQRSLFNVRFDIELDIRLHIRFDIRSDIRFDIRIEYSISALQFGIRAFLKYIAYPFYMNMSGND